MCEKPALILKVHFLSLYWNIPIANTTTVLLGTGTSVTQAVAWFSGGFASKLLRS